MTYIAACSSSTKGTGRSVILTRLGITESSGGEIVVSKWYYIVDGDDDENEYSGLLDCLLKSTIRSEILLSSKADPDEKCTRSFRERLRARRASFGTVTVELKVDDNY